VAMPRRVLTLLLVLYAPGLQAARVDGTSTLFSGASGTVYSADTGRPSEDSYLPVEPEAPEAAETPEGEFKVVTLEEAAGYLAGKKAIFVDARSKQAWEMGHIPGAIDVPSSDFEKGFAAAKSRLPKDATIIVYCESSHCDQAVDVATRLKALGYLHILHYKQGWVIWDWSKKPREKSGKYKDWR